MSAEFFIIYIQVVFYEKIKFHIDLHPYFLGKEARVGAIFIFLYCLDCGKF